MGEPRYVIDLVKRVTTVSVETMAIVKALPPLEQGALRVMTVMFGSNSMTATILEGLR